MVVERGKERWSESVREIERRDREMAFMSLPCVWKRRICCVKGERREDRGGRETSFMYVRVLLDYVYGRGGSCV